MPHITEFWNNIAFREFSKTFLLQHKPLLYPGLRPAKSQGHFGGFFRFLFFFVFPKKFLFFSYFFVFVLFLLSLDKVTVYNNSYYTN